MRQRRREEDRETGAGKETMTPLKRTVGHGATAADCVWEQRLVLTQTLSKKGSSN